MIFAPLVRHKKQIIYVFWLLYFVLLTFVIWTITTPEQVLEWRTYGFLAAKAALYLFLITLIPGIIKRFKISQYAFGVDTFIMAFRRQMGLAMYFLAFSHYLWMKLLPTFRFFDGKFRIDDTFEVFGMLALFILLPVALTSSNYAVRKLKQNWQRVHNLVHVAIYLIALHVVLINKTSIHSIAITIFVIFDITSFIYFHKMNNYHLPK